MYNLPLQTNINIFSAVHKFIEELTSFYIVIFLPVRYYSVYHYLFRRTYCITFRRGTSKYMLSDTQALISIKKNTRISYENSSKVELASTFFVQFVNQKAMTTSLGFPTELGCIHMKGKWRSLW